MLMEKLRRQARKVPTQAQGMTNLLVISKWEKSAPIYVHMSPQSLGPSARKVARATLRNAISQAVRRRQTNKPSAS